MASDSRALTLKLLADVADFQKKMDQSEKTTEGFSGKVTEFGKKAAAAFAVAAAAAVAYAGKLAIDGVKAAIEDAAAQQRLATTLKSVTGATDEAIGSTEQFIGNLSRAFGVADDQLRPAYSRLAIATGSLKTANDSLSLALDIAAAKGISVETVANALGKAYEGNTASLARLGVGLSSAEIKTLGLEGTIQKLSDTFGGSALAQSKTFEGQVARMNVAFDEFKETIGFALLPILQKLLNFFNENLGPATEKIRQTFMPLTKAISDNKDEMQTLWSFLQKYVVPILSGALKLAIQGIATSFTALITVLGKAVQGFQAIYDKYKDFVDFIKNNPITKFLDKINPFNNSSFVQTSNLMASNALGFGQATVMAAQQPEISAAALEGMLAGGVYTHEFLRERGLTPSQVNSLLESGRIMTATPEGFTLEQMKTLGTTTEEQVNRYLELRAAGQLESTFGKPTEVNITVNGAIDPEGTARTIQDVLNQSFGRGTGGAGVLLGATF